jgi:hypothetical protein
VFDAPKRSILAVNDVSNPAIPFEAIIRNVAAPYLQAVIDAALAMLIMTVKDVWQV